jgi:hypothetical protein
MSKVVRINFRSFRASGLKFKSGRRFRFTSTRQESDSSITATDRRIFIVFRVTPKSLPPNTAITWSSDSNRRNLWLSIAHFSMTEAVIHRQNSSCPGQIQLLRWSQKRLPMSFILIYSLLLSLSSFESHCLSLPANHVHLIAFEVFSFCALFLILSIFALENRVSLWPQSIWPNCKFIFRLPSSPLFEGHPTSHNQIAVELVHRLKSTFVALLFEHEVPILLSNFLIQEEGAEEGARLDDDQERERERGRRNDLKSRKRTSD